MSENIMQSQINQILELVKSHDKHFDVLSKQMQQVDKRLTKLEAIAEQHDQRFNSIENRFSSMENRISSMENRIDKMDGRIDRLTDKIDSMYKWIIGLILGLLLPMWGSIIIAILLKK